MTTAFNNDKNVKSTFSIKAVVLNNPNTSDNINLYIVLGLTGTLIYKKRYN